MAKGKKTGGRDIKPGQVLNPNGRPKLDPETKQLRKLTNSRFQEVAHKYISCTISELQDIFKNPETPALDLILIKILIESANKGDVAKLNFFLERLIGKVRDEVHMTGDANSELLAIIKARNGAE